MTALIYGASGLVGGYLLTYLIESVDFQKVILYTRKKIAINSPKIEQIIDGMEALKLHQKELIADHIFCCLGTTKNKTPDKDEYYKIDHDFPLMAAAIGLENGTKHFHLVSALGADQHSMIFYNKTKGELERDIKLLPFQSINIYQPSLLTGSRKEKRNVEEITEKIFYFINPLLVGSLKKYRSISAKTVAAAMFNQALNNNQGLHIFKSDEIKEIA
ncbi:nucleoside-diphosphate sugar epimerase [Olivibacter sp. SDN3]|uniref:nucleoside-diphosphate sugar epimerase n=1 Tax=Olivibacter sp. SDN3 TaxID=2764720 RepID=UPI0016516539|nr:nucleoside-diphosphate sugar epimerase [Olivibacter sp. SDN3]QNL51116.1 nucleoside-diphosphate sugar epimerase [Olivibacter sp. SDN3]